jgi:hypothetical protein
MNAPLRFLTLRAHGNEVSRLHAGLLELGWAIASDELSGAFFGATTRMAVAEFQRQRDLPMTGAFDEVADRLLMQEAGTRPKRSRVVGIVRHPNGNPGSGLVVRAFDRDLRREQPLGEAETDGQGFYQIAYGREQFARAEKATADLMLRVYRRDEVLYDPGLDATIFNAPDLVVVNIQLAKGETETPSEYERLRDVITPLLDRVALHDLREDDQSRDITFLAGETREPAHKLAHFAVAQKLGKSYEIVPEFFYSLFAENTLLRASQGGTVGVRFDINMETELLPLLYDVVLLPHEIVRGAVQQAVDHRFVPRDLLNRLDEILDRLRTWLREAQTYVADERPRVLFRQVERFVAAGKHEEVLRILQADALGDLPRLFERLTNAAAFTGREQAVEAETDASLLELLGGQSRIVARVRESKDINRPEDITRLARMDRAEWSAALRGPIREELIDLHALALVRTMEKRFPTAAFAGRLERDATAFEAERTEILKLLETHPELDLARTNIDRVAGELNSAARETLKSIQRVFKVAPTFDQTTALLQRGVRSAGAIHAMGETRFVRDFAEHSPFTLEEAHVAYQKATDIHIASGLLAGDIQAASGAGRLSILLNGEPAEKLAKLEAVAEDFPNMESLFQLDDYCACEECRSVHSAAAYVADTLQFLKNRQVVDTTVSPAVSVQIAKDVLFARRPDLGDTDLNCDNTNTPIPYIDVVCELLEEAVSPDPDFVFNGSLPSGIVSPALLAALQAKGLPFSDQAVVYDPDLAGDRIVRDTKVVCKLTPSGGGNWIVRLLRQTHGTAAERAASPEYLSEAAYVTLAGTEFAFRLPFDLFHQETRAYFQRFDVSRAELMRGLQTPAGPLDAAIAAEAIGLSDDERALIGTVNVAAQNTYWNTGATPAADVIKIVDAFVTKTELTYADLENLLDLAWLNPGNALFIRHLDNSCSLAKKEIQKLDAAALDRFHRFIRLWKKTRWTITAIDRLIRAAKIGAGTLDDACLVRMHQASRLSSTLGLLLDEVCNLFDAIPWEGESSRYARIFLNLTANGTVENDFLPANVLQNEANEIAVPGSGTKLSAYKDYLALCLGMTPADSGLLVDALGATAILSAANVAAIYAHNLLGRKLRLSASELLILRTLTGIDFLASPGETLRFVEKVEKVRAAGVKPADLQYLLIHEAANLNDRILRDETITEILTGLQQGYQALFGETRSPFDPLASVQDNANAVRTLLAKLPGFSESDLTRMQDVVDDRFQDPILTPAAYIDEKLAALVDTTPIKAKQSALPPATAALAAAQTTLDTAVAALEAAVTPAQAAVAAAQVAAATTQVNTAAAQLALDQQALLQSIADALSVYLYAAGKEELLEAEAMKVFKLSEELTPIVLELARLKQPVTAGNRTLLDLLTDDALVDIVNTPPTPPAITPATFDDQYRALRLLHLMAKFLATLELPAATVAWMLTNNPTLGWLELDDLMYEAGVTPVTFDAWERLQDTLRFIAAYPPVENPSDPAKPFSATGLFELSFAGATLVQLEAYLARLAGWDAAVLADMDARFAHTVADFQLPTTYTRLDAAIALLRTLGLNVAAAVGLIKAKLTAVDAALMRAALKARYEESEWLDALEGVQDPLREQKRDALVAYLLAVNPAMKSSNHLYDYFLIDVEMTACMPTSRIVQVHATIQLFVMRCLMGLEPRSVANIKQDSGWQQWKWMANFRVWEANRKIFLWPENWIEPELRDDKSELFTTMENTLQQNELTDRAVEDAAIAYLEQLDDIAHLDVMACYYEVELRTMHVVARTKGGDPAVYYYRQFQKERYWTPWEKVDLDITGDHLLAFDRNSRLTLAWPIFTSEAEESAAPVPNPATDIPAGGKPTEKPRKRWKIQLAVSERSGKKWLPKKVSKEGLYSPSPTGYFSTDPPATDTYNFFAWNLGPAGQAISCSNIGAGWVGSFALTGCKGYPEPSQGGSIGVDFSPKFKDTQMRALRFAERNQDATDDLSIFTIFSQGTYDTITARTPGNFNVTYPMQMSVIDWIFLFLQVYFASTLPTFAGDRRARFTIPLGTFMPYFYGDFSRTYVIIPGFYERQHEDPSEPRTEKMFSDIIQFVEDALALFFLYLHKLQQDPAHDLNKLLAELSVDPKFLALRAEQEVYQKLLFGLKFRNFYHPLVCFLRSTLNRDGFPALMQRDVQLRDTLFDFNTVYGPSGLVAQPYPREDVDFDLDGAYSAYNWELFFHIPFEIGVRLSQDGRYAEAQSWFHYIFNPVGATDAPAPQKYWITKPFFKTTVADYLEQRIDTIMNTIAADPSGASITDLKFAVSEWRDKPFQPHVVARSRPVAYQIALVLKYIQNLLDWGDNLFRQFTRESVTQATQMYILADKLLGPKPRIVPMHVTPPDMTYNQLESRLDLFSNALIDLETMIPDLELLPHGGEELPPPPVTVSALYFCIPPNEKMLQMWDVVADRLFKIRHCQNIDGVESILALFSPPIDPGALVRAAAAGIDISAFLAGLSAPLPAYRFNVMSQKATELAQQVGVLGNALLQALEKRDAEKLSRLRSGQEMAVLDSVRLVKLATIEESKASLEGLKRSRQVVEERKSYYAGQDYMNVWEGTAVTLSGLSLIGEAAIAVGYILSGGLKLIPSFEVGAAGFGGTPEVSATMGGQQIGNSAEMAVNTIASIVRALDKAASMAATQGGYQRRQEEWEFQVRLADRELAQIDQQIATSGLHLDMLDKDLKAHDLQSTHAKQTDAFMRAKYTNQELYDWMIGQISAVYFKAYKLAFDVAKKAERCFQHELGTDATFLRFGYWDSLKKGLMTAEALHHDIKRMEVAYLDQNRREYELTKNVSLAQLDPFALVQLKQTGKCAFQIPEALFDLDHPGHIMRRNRLVSVSIPCVAGPNTTVSCKLSLVSNRYRKNAAQRQGVATAKDKYDEQPGNDGRFVYNVGSIQSISTCTGSSDSGLFEFSSDDRYRPFEGTGAIGTWQIEMPARFPQFDYDTISDVILHLRYTAREGGSTFKSLVEDALAELLNEMRVAAKRTGLFQAFDLKHNFSNEWHRLKQSNTTPMTLRLDHLPFFVQGHTPALDKVTWMARVKGDPALFVMSIDATPFNLNRDASLDNLCVGSSSLLTLGTPFTLTTANAANLEDLVVLLHYAIAV